MDTKLCRQNYRIPMSPLLVDAVLVVMYRRIKKTNKKKRQRRPCYTRSCLASSFPQWCYTVIISRMQVLPSGVVNEICSLRLPSCDQQVALQHQLPVSCAEAESDEFYVTRFIMVVQPLEINVMHKKNNRFLWHIWLILGNGTSKMCRSSTSGVIIMLLLHVLRYTHISHMVLYASLCTKLNQDIHL